MSPHPGGGYFVLTASGGGSGVLTSSFYPNESNCSKQRVLRWTPALSRRADAEIITACPQTVVQGGDDHA